MNQLLENYLHCDKCMKYLLSKQVKKHMFRLLEKKTFESTATVENRIHDLFHDGVGYKSIIHEEKIDLMSETIIEHIQISEILKCTGCKNIVFRKQNHKNDIFIDWSVYPDYQDWHKKRNFHPEDGVPEIIYNTYCELIDAFNMGLNIACGTFCGTIIDVLCDSQKIKEPLLVRKIEALQVDNQYKEVSVTLETSQYTRHIQKKERN